MELPDFGSPCIRASLGERVLHLRVDRPERRNSYTQDMYRALKRAAIWSARQDDLDAVCLTGTERWFGAGGDLSGRTGDGVVGLDEEWDGTDHFPFRHIERSPKIWVAAVNGVCHAGGVDLCLHCDVVIASDRATFRVPELLRGLPDPHIPARLVASVGLARARWMIFTAAEIDAATAERFGLVAEVVPHDQLQPRVEWVLAQIRATGPGSRAVLKRDINDRLPIGDIGLFSRVPPAEIQEGMRSFVEKRAPIWR